MTTLKTLLNGNFIELAAAPVSSIVVSVNAYTMYLGFFRDLTVLEHLAFKTGWRRNVTICEFGPLGEGVASLEAYETYIGSITYPPGGRFGPRRQPDFELVILHSGTMDVRIDEASYTIPSGTVTLLKPGHMEEFFFTPDRNTWHRWIQIGVSHVSAGQKAWFEALPLYVSLTEQFNQLTDTMLDLQNAPGCQDVWCTTTLNILGLSAIAMFVLQCRRQQHCDIVNAAVDVVKNFVRDNYRSDIHLSDMAHEAHLSSEHLIRVFRRFEGQTPIQYLWMYRVQRSLSLLRDTEFTISDIAERTGFKTSYHFARTIKCHTGLTPTEVRQQGWAKMI